MIGDLGRIGGTRMSLLAALVIEGWRMLVALVVLERDGLWSEWQC
jgi:hypothetical protein